MKFSQLGLIEPIVRAVTKAGHVAPTPIQALAIPEALSGKDVLGAAETGTGKTAAFVLPVVQRLLQITPQKRPLSRRVRALIITATKELAAKIGDRFSAYGRNSGLHCLTLLEPGHATLLAGPVRSVDVLITTPERLVDLHNHGGVDLRAVEILVIDEADRMLAMNSLQDVQRIISQLPLDRQTLLFSATLPAAITALADSILRNPARIRIPPTQKAAEHIHQTVCFVDRAQKSTQLISWLGRQAPARTVVFTRTRQGADRVTRQLLSCGIRAEAIHGEKTLSARQQTLSRFISPNPPVLVATDLAARGIDVDSISYIVNYDLPLEPETYVHRLGRIARAGGRGLSVAFCDENERPLLRGIERLLRREIPADDGTNPADKPPGKLAPVEEVVAPVAKRSTAGRRAQAPEESTRPSSPRRAAITEPAPRASVAGRTSVKPAAAPPLKGTTRGRADAGLSQKLAASKVAAAPASSRSKASAPSSKAAVTTSSKSRSKTASASTSARSTSRATSGAKGAATRSSSERTAKTEKKPTTGRRATSTRRR